MEIPLVDLKAQYDGLRDQMRVAMDAVLETTAFIQGPDVRAFEAEFAAFCGAGHALGISSGTDALHLALRAVGVGAGDEVITSPHTFTATAEAIVMAGARPVFADIDPHTFNIDPAQIPARITARTKAIMPVHLYGQPADMDPILELARAHGIAVVEDAAQAHGATYKGRRVGTLADAACFSFYPGKNLGAYGDAGGITTDRDDVADRVRMSRDHGRRDKYEHLEVGFGNRLDTLQAAVLRVKLRALPGWNARRAAIAARYSAALPALAPQVPAWAGPAWHLYVIRVTNREHVRTVLREAGIHTGVHYPVPLHLQPAYRDLGYGAEAFPVAEAAAREVLSLPLYPELSDADADRVIDALRKV
jgi:dTDP-4-amino-4,6-dideoxygalactose transaminase